jgi:tetratricopeptide (TPR) repeat protein
MHLAEELGNKTEIENTLINIGQVYEIEADHTKAQDYYFKALEIGKELGSKSQVAVVLGNIGTSYSDQAERSTSFKKRDELYRKAMDYKSKALLLNRETGDKFGVAITLGDVGSLYRRMKNYKEAEDYLERALLLSREINAMELIRDFERSFSELDSARGNFRSALEHYKKHIAARDSITNDENIRKQTRSEMNFEFAKKQESDSLKTDAEKKVATAQLRSEKNKRYSLYGGLGLVMVFAGFIFNRFRVTQKQKKIIESQKEVVEEQKKIVEEKNKEVLDSIHYARRIQRAIIPSDKYISRVLEKLRKN